MHFKVAYKSQRTNELFLRLDDGRVMVVPFEHAKFLKVGDTGKISHGLNSYKFTVDYLDG